MDADGSKNVIRGLAVVLVIAMAVPVGLAGTAGADGAPCSEFNEVGWIMLAHEDADSHPLSQLLYQSILNDRPQRTWTNGIDSYVIDLGCIATSTWTFCVDDQDFDSNDGIRLLTQPLVEPEYEVAFYDADGRTELDQFDKSDTDVRPDDSTPRAVCEDIPEHSRYAVVYLDEGTVNGVQLEDFIWGPFTSKFRFTMLEA